MNRLIKSTYFTFKILRMLNKTAVCEDPLPNNVSSRIQEQTNKETVGAKEIDKCYTGAGKSKQ